MQTQAVLYLGVCILSFFCIISLPVSGNQMHEKCQEASTLINNLTATTPRDDDGCVMKFQTKRGICCLIGIKLNQREHFKGRYFIDNQCFKFKCLYNGKKRKWEKCKCRKNKDLFARFDKDDDDDDDDD
ncbi:uncharacterized protein LOC133175944 [Saccostrea echinata]|uniref:uncharacterized protein LOC133175944 n=1 Tax=Saccostrea echinata TaxID=191078 RepID=UPI002A80BC40|nr:uncharacterized protein LOC133175944 [Saccostrea echinata]